MSTTFSEGECRVDSTELDDEGLEWIGAVEWLEDAAAVDDRVEEAVTEGFLSTSVLETPEFAESCVETPVDAREDTPECAEAAEGVEE